MFKSQLQLHCVQEATVYVECTKFALSDCSNYKKGALYDPRRYRSNEGKAMTLEISKKKTKKHQHP